VRPGIDFSHVHEQARAERAFFAQQARHGCDELVVFELRNTD
jgi:hypothetical protein